MSHFAIRMKHQYANHWRHLYRVVECLSVIHRLNDEERAEFCRQYIHEGHIERGILLLGRECRSDFDDFIGTLAAEMFPHRLRPAPEAKVRWHHRLWRSFRRTCSF